MQHPFALVPQSKPKFGAMLPTKLTENPPKVGHSPTCMHTSAFVWFANIATHKSIPRKIVIWNLKDLDLCSPMKDLDMAILKSLNPLTHFYPNLVPTTKFGKEFWSL
jgi:hypothetical protein